MNGLRDAFARLGCVEEAHVADGAVLFRVDGAEASAVPGGVLADHVRPAHVGDRARRPTQRDGSEAAALARLGAMGIAYVTRGGRPECETYPDFGLDDVLDALERSR